MPRASSAGSSGLVQVVVQPDEVEGRPIQACPRSCGPSAARDSAIRRRKPRPFLSPQQPPCRVRLHGVFVALKTGTALRETVNRPSHLKSKRETKWRWTGPSEGVANPWRDRARLREDPDARRSLRGRPAAPFNPGREELLAARVERQAVSTAAKPDFLAETVAIPRRRLDSGAVARGHPRPPRRDHRPVDRKMIINALNCGANRRFMADFEDANSPTWANMVEGRSNLRDAIAATIRRSRRRARVQR